CVGRADQDALHAGLLHQGQRGGREAAQAGCAAGGFTWEEGQGLCGAVEEWILCALKGRESEILNSKTEAGRPVLRRAARRFRACDGADVLLKGERRGMVSLTRSLESDMSQIGKFTQPDASPAYFIEFLEFLDKREEIRQVRAQAAKGLNLAAGHKVLD